MSQRKDKTIYKHMERFPKLYYLTYWLSFPDGDLWVQQRPVTNDLDIELQNIVKGHKDSEWATRAESIRKFGDVWWKDHLGVEHRMVLERTKRRKRWGTQKKGMGDIESGLTAEDIQKRRGNQ